MTLFKSAVLGAAFAASFVSVPVNAIEAGDFIVRIGGAVVDPNDSSESFDGPTATGLGSVKASVDNDAAISLTLEYMFTKNIGLQLLGSSPFNHDISATLNGQNLGRVAKTKHLPPTLTLNWHFSGMGNFVPHIGAGVNYLHFFNENTTGALESESINLSDSWGPAGLVGFDYELGDGWTFNMQYFYIKSKPEAHISGGWGNADVDLDPSVFVASFGKRF